MDEHIITDQEYLQKVKQWAENVRRQAKENASAFTKGKHSIHTYIKGRYAGYSEGMLKNKLKSDFLQKYGDIYSVRFKMPVHGIFREYGVGNGQPRNGVATKSGRKGSGKIYVRRSMSDWFHGPLERNVGELADIVADYYGDRILVQFKKIDINTISHQGLNL